MRACKRSPGIHDWPPVLGCPTLLLATPSARPPTPRAPSVCKATHMPHRLQDHPFSLEVSPILIARRQARYRLRTIGRGPLSPGVIAVDGEAVPATFGTSTPGVQRCFSRCARVGTCLSLSFLPSTKAIQSSSVVGGGLSLKRGWLNICSSRSQLTSA